MRTYLIPAAVAASLAFAPVAFAAAQQANGTVKSYSAKTSTLTLADGSVYMLPKTFKNPGLKAGEKVNIAWDMQGKHKMAQSVTIAK
ncbi:DUF1344 domain-containing protein [Mesorhizobium sp. ASY16-5R]|uniref:DUF1344 domain-containing protein n=1 Tax=Mesorhizobium sp. ASY16-5R TaxID=3445772 RepID=UPI003FA0E324